MNHDYIDIIDKEIFLESDKENSWQELHTRDRNIYLQAEQKQSINKHSSDRELILLWLKALRSGQYSSIALKSDAIKPYRYISVFLALFCFVIGYSSITAFLYYSGKEAINIMSFLCVFIGSQYLILTLSFFYILVSKKSSTLIWKDIFSYFTKKYIARNLRGARRKSLTIYVQKVFQNQNLSHLFTTYTSYFQQKLAVAFNLGLISGFFYKIISVDLAFGWQSTLNISASTLLRAVQIVSTPWSWTPVPSPNIAEIIGSKITLKDGLYNLAQTDLTAWWPFLLMTLVVYGLVPRLLLLSLSLIRKKQALRNAISKGLQIQDIIQRMRTPIVHTKTINSDKKCSEPAFKNTRQTTPPQTRDVTILVPYDIYPLATCHLDNWLRRHGFGIAPQICFMKDYGSDMDIITEIGKEPTLIFMEAAMPALGEFLFFITELQEKSQHSVHIALITASQPDFSDTIPKSIFMPWLTKIENLGNDQIQLIQPSFEAL